MKKTTRGIIPEFYDISEESIIAVLAEYRSEYPEDKRPDEELRPLTVNHLVYQKFNVGKGKHNAQMA